MLTTTFEKLRKRWYSFAFKLRAEMRARIKLGQLLKRVIPKLAAAVGAAIQGVVVMNDWNLYTRIQPCQIDRAACTPLLMCRKQAR